MFINKYIYIYIYTYIGTLEAPLVGTSRFDTQVCASENIDAQLKHKWL